MDPLVIALGAIVFAILVLGETKPPPDSGAALAKGSGVGLLLTAAVVLFILLALH